MKKNDLEKQKSDILVRVKEIRVSDQRSLDTANVFLSHVKATIKEAEAFFSDPIKKAHDAHKAMIAAKKQITGPLEMAERAIKGEVRSYLAEVERAEREARERAEFEQAAFMRKRENQKKRGDIAGANETREAIFDRHEERMKIKEAPKMTGGTYTVKRYVFEIVDESLIPRQYMKPDEKRIGAVVRQLKDRTEIPGVRVFQDIGIGVKS